MLHEFPYYGRKMFHGETLVNRTEWHYKYFVLLKFSEILKTS